MRSLSALLALSLLCACPSPPPPGPEDGGTPAASPVERPPSALERPPSGPGLPDDLKPPGR